MSRDPGAPSPGSGAPSAGRGTGNERRSSVGPTGRVTIGRTLTPEQHAAFKAAVELNDSFEELVDDILAADGYDVKRLPPP